MALHNLGRMAFRRGDYTRALALFNESLPIWRELEDKQHIAMALNNLGRVASRQGDYSGARAFLVDALMIRCELGDKPGIAYSLEGFASLATAQGRASWAARLFGAAEALREAIRVPLLPPDRPEYEQTVNAAHSSLGEEAFAEHWATGRAMTLEEAIAEVSRG